MTFGKKCDRACSPFEYTECGKTREEEEDQDGLILYRSLGEQKCSQCRHWQDTLQDEEKRVKIAIMTGRIARGTRIHLDEIKNKIPTVRDTRIKARLMAAITQLEANQEEEREFEEGRGYFERVMTFTV